MINANTIIDFWFKQLKPQQWFQEDARLDEFIRQKFGLIHQKAIACELSDWRVNATGSLAEIIILDQFSRNIYRNQPESFAFDGMALLLAQESIRRQLDKDLPPKQRAFLYMPFMHSESVQIHEIAMTLFSDPELKDNLHFEIAHFDIIKQFGRYPHRNKILGRISTNDELLFLTKHQGF